MQYNFKHNISNIVTDYIKGLESVWIVGDKFVFRTCEEYFKQRDHHNYNGFAKENYEILSFASSKYASNNKSVIGRVRNELLSAMKQETYLPKLIVVILDDDVIRCLDVSNSSSYVVWKRAIHWLMNKFKQDIMDHKQFLPTKVKRDDQPKIVWIQAPLNTDFKNNEDRLTFNSLLESIGKQFNNNVVLQLKQIWESDNRNYFLPNILCYTSTGLKKYWEAIDRTIRYSLVAKKATTKYKNLSWNRGQNAHKDGRSKLLKPPPAARKQLTYDDVQF